MIKRRYKQIAKISKWRDEKLKCHAFVVTCGWLSLRMKYIFPKSFFFKVVITDAENQP
jgi:hypothetical protein